MGLHCLIVGGIAVSRSTMVFLIIQFGCSKRHRVWHLCRCAKRVCFKFGSILVCFESHNDAEMTVCFSPWKTLATDNITSTVAYNAHHGRFSFTNGELSRTRSFKMNNWYYTCATRNVWIALRLQHLQFFNALTLVTSVVCFATRLGIANCMLGPLPLSPEHRWITQVWVWRLFGSKVKVLFSYLDFVICPMVPNILADCCHTYLQKKLRGQVGLNFLSRGARCWKHDSGWCALLRSGSNSYYQRSAGFHKSNTCCFMLHLTSMSETSSQKNRREVATLRKVSGSERKYQPPGKSTFSFAATPTCQRKHNNIGTIHATAPRPIHSQKMQVPAGCREHNTPK